MTCPSISFSPFLVGAFLVKSARLLQWLVFLVGAFSFKEKSQTITAAFFSSDHRAHRYVPLFTETDKFTQAKFDQCKLTAKGPPFRFLPFLRNLQNRKTPKGPPFQFFFGTVRIFFSKIFNVSRVPPSDFLIFCNRKYVNDFQRVALFHFLALCDVFEVFSKKNSKFFSKKISIFFVFPVGKNDFPVISSMKGTLWVSRKCFQSFS